MSLVVSYILLGTILLGPLVITAALIFYMKTNQQEVLKRKFGQLIKDIDCTTVHKICYFSYFVLFRLLFVLIIFYI